MNTNELEAQLKGVNEKCNFLNKQVAKRDAMILSLARAVDDLRSAARVNEDFSPYHEVSEIIRTLEPAKDGPPGAYDDDMRTRMEQSRQRQAPNVISGPQQFLQDIAPLQKDFKVGDHVRVKGQGYVASGRIQEDDTKSTRSGLVLIQFDETGRTLWADQALVVPFDPRSVPDRITLDVEMNG